MSNRISVNDRLKKEKEERPVDELFKPTDEKGKKESKKEIKKDKEELRRQTYYISEVLIDALKFKKAFEDKDISEIVREALEENIDEKYIKMAEKKYK